jgi:hypothetical protein
MSKLIACLRNFLRFTMSINECDNARKKIPKHVGKMQVKKFNLITHKVSLMHSRYYGKTFQVSRFCHGSMYSNLMTPFMGVLQVGHITPKKQPIIIQALDQQLQKKKMDTPKSKKNYVLSCLTFLIHVRTHCFM